MSTQTELQMPTEEMVRQVLMSHDLDIVSSNASKLKSESPTQMARCPSFFDNILNQVQETTKNKFTVPSNNVPPSKSPESELSPFHSDESDSEKGNESPKEKRGGRRKIDIKFINNKSRRHVTFSKRKAGLIKKAYELSTLTGTQVLLLVASETGNVYTFATPKLQPLINQEEGKTLIQQCLNSDPVPIVDTSNQQVSNETPTIQQQLDSQKMDIATQRVRNYLIRDTSIGSFAKSILREQLSTANPDQNVNNLPKQNTVLNQYQQKPPTLTPEMLAVTSGLPLGVNYANLLYSAQQQTQANYVNTPRQAPQLVSTGSFSELLKGNNFLDLQ